MTTEEIWKGMKNGTKTLRLGVVAYLFVSKNVKLVLMNCNTIWKGGIQKTIMHSTNANKMYGKYELGHEKT